MKRILLTLIAFLLMIFGGLTFAQEKDWIKYDADVGTVTVYSPDGSYGIVIQDKNLGATMTGGGKSAPAASYGNFYQWGNNYGFPSDPNATISKTTTKVDASSYGPENPYSSDIFIKSDGDWSSVRNDNLRGGTGDDENNGYGLTSNNPITGRQGPCPEGYHVPSLGDWNELVVLRYNNRYHADLSTGDLFYLTSTATLTGVDDLMGDNAPVSLAFTEDMLIPFASIRWYDDGTVETSYIGLIGMLWSSTPDDEYSDHLNLLRTTRGNPKEWFFKVAPDYDYRGEAGSVRCFKDERVYRTTSKTLTLNVMSGENLVSTGVSFTDDEPLTSGQVLDAIDWLSNEIELATGYHFEWYANDGGVETGFDLDTAISEGTITSNLALTGKIEPNKYTISFLDESGAEIMSGEFTYDQETTLPANTSTKEGYTFKGWKDGQGNTYEDGATIKNLTTENGAVLEFNPIREQNPKPSTSGGGGGGGRKHRNSTTNTGDDSISQSGNQIDFAISDGDPQEILSNGYTRELNDAYKFAYKYGITTMTSIEQADMGGSLTRIAMAKMLSQYAINILGLKPDTTRIPNFSDVSKEIDGEYNDGVTLAYQLGIMGINMPDSRFRPFDLVPRSEFVTALSRMKYKTPDGKILYYSTHMNLLGALGIVTNKNPDLQEIRGYVMLMLMRSTMMGDSGYNSANGEILDDNLIQEKVDNYFTEAYKVGKIYYKIGDLQRLLKSLGYYNGEINNTYNRSTLNAVYNFQVAMGILDINDTENPARGYIGPETRDILNQKWAEYQLSQ